MTHHILSFAFTILFLTSTLAQNELAVDFELTKDGIPFLPQVEQLSETDKTSSTSTMFKGRNRRNCITLKAGTLIEFKSMESIPWERVAVGHRIRFTVYRDVIIDGHIVVSAGTVAMGLITDVIEATPNSPEAVYIEIERVPAVDGQMIDLSGIQEKISTRLTGTSIDIPSRTLVSGYVLNNRAVALN